MKANYTINRVVSRGTHQFVLRYKDILGNRKQKWFDTELPERGNARKAEEMKPKAVEAWQDILEILDGTQKTIVLNINTDKGAPLGHQNEKLKLFADLLLEWLPTRKRKLQDSTYCGYALVLNGIIEPYFRKLGTDVRQVDEKTIEGFYNSQRDQGKTENTLKHYHTLIRQTLQYAVKEKLIRFNPADLTDKLVKDDYISDIYSATEIKNLLETFRNDQLFVPVVLGAFYGLRRSEIIGLKWDAIDFENKTITLQTVAYIKKVKGTPDKQLLKPKMKSKTTLPLIPAAESVLLAERKKQAENRAKYGKNYCKDFQNMVCVHENGDLVKLGYVSEHFTIILENKNMKVIRFHDLRHSCATILYNNGIPQIDLMDWLGHSDMSTTNRYTHRVFANKIPAAETVNRVLSR